MCQRERENPCENNRGRREDWLGLSIMTLQPFVFPVWVKVHVDESVSVKGSYH